MDFSYDQSVLSSEEDIKAKLQKEETEPKSYEIEDGTVTGTVSDETTILSSEQFGYKSESQTNMEQNSPRERFLPDLIQEDNQMSLTLLKQIVPNEELGLDFKPEEDKSIYQTFSEETIPNEGFGLDFKQQENKLISETFSEETSLKEELGLDFKHEDEPVYQTFSEEAIPKERLGLDFNHQENKLISQTFSEETTPNEGLGSNFKQQEDKPVYQTFSEETLSNKGLGLDIKRDDETVYQTFSEETIPKEGLDFKQQEDKLPSQAFSEETLPTEELGLGFKPKEDETVYQTFSEETLPTEGLGMDFKHGDGTVYQTFSEETIPPKELELDFNQQEDKPTHQTFSEETHPNEGLDFKQQEDKLSQSFSKETLPNEELGLGFKPEEDKTVYQTFSEETLPNEGLDFKQQEDKLSSQSYSEETLPTEELGLDFNQQENKLISQTFSEETLPNEEKGLDFKPDDEPVQQTFSEGTIPNEGLGLNFKQQEDKLIPEIALEQTVPNEGSVQEDKPVTQAFLEATLPNEGAILDIKQVEEKPLSEAVTVEVPSYEEGINEMKNVESSNNPGIASDQISLDDAREQSELQPAQNNSPQSTEELQKQTKFSATSGNMSFDNDREQSQLQPPAQDNLPQSTEKFQSQTIPSTTSEQASTREYIYDKDVTYSECVMDSTQTMQHNSDDEDESLEKEIENLTGQPIRILNKPKDTHRYTPVDESSYSSNSGEEEYSTKHNYQNESPSDQKEIVQASGVEKKEHLYKILVIGELGTGKTSIIKRYVHQFFSQHYRATIGVDFALKVISWDSDTLIRLQLWDIAGQERFGNMTRVYYKEAVGAFVVFDVTRVPTFEAVVKWKNDLDSKVQLPDGSNIPCVLLANKCDQTKEGLVNNTDQMDDFCKEKGFLNWFETSAKENINIDEAARYLVGQILKNDQSMNTGSTEEDKERIQLANANQQEATKKSCCR